GSICSMSPAELQTANFTRPAESSGRISGRRSQPSKARSVATTPKRGSGGPVEALASARWISRSVCPPTYWPWLLIETEASYQPGGRSGRSTVVAGRGGGESCPLSRYSGGGLGWGSFELPICDCRPPIEIGPPPLPSPGV